MALPTPIIDAFRNLLGVDTPNIDNLITRLSSGNVKSKEGPFLEFKASYVPEPEDDATPDACRWNVIEAIVGMANSQGGCVVLGLAENKDNKNHLERGNGDPDGVLKESGKEDKDLAEHTRKALFKGDSFKISENETIKVDQDFWKQLESQTTGTKGFATCLSHVGGNTNGFPVVAIFVEPIPAKKPLIEVEIVKNHTEHSIVYPNRSKTSAETILSVHSKWKTEQPKKSKSGDVTIIERGRIDDSENKRFEEEYMSFVIERQPQRALDVLSEKINNLDSTAMRTVYSSVIPPQATNFVGRDNELENLHGLLLEGKIPVVTGPGGMGKSELVIQYAERHKTDYPGGLFQIDMGTVKSWDEAFHRLLITTRVDMWGLLGFLKPENEGNNGQEPTAMEIAGALARRAEQDGRILLFLDNVESVEDFLGESILEREATLPPYVSIVATARQANIRFEPNDRGVELQLLALPLEASIKLLIQTHSADTDAEQKAAAKIAELVGRRPLYLCRIRALLTGKPRPFAKSYSDLKPKSRKDLLDMVGTAMAKTHDDRTPDALWNLTREALSKDPAGVALIKLAHISSFFSPDGFRVHILRHLWDELIAPNTDAGCTFEDALEVLSWHWILACNGGEVQMSRLDAEALCRSVRDLAPTLGMEIGTVLAKFPGFDLREWPKMLDSGIPLPCCPIHLLNPNTLREVLPRDWTLLNAGIIEEFNADDICWALINGPEDLANLPWHWSQLEEVYPKSGFKTFDLKSYPTSPLGQFCPTYWTLLLEKRPTLIRRCCLSNLPHDDLWAITKRELYLVDDNPFFKENPRGLPHYLLTHPEVATSELLSRLDAEGWNFLCHASSKFKEKVPSEITSLFKRIDEEEKKREEEEMKHEEERQLEQALYDDSNYDIKYFYNEEIMTRSDFLVSQNGRRMAVYLIANPEDLNARTLSPLLPNDWIILFAEHPDLMTANEETKIHGASPKGWMEAVMRNPEFPAKCPEEFKSAGGWSMFSGSNWVLILEAQPELEEHCDKRSFSGADWANLVSLYPSLAEQCPWSVLTGEEYSSLLVSHPEWAAQFGLSFESLNEKQWIELLQNHPEYHAHCHCRFSSDSAMGLTRLLYKHPDLLDAMVCRNSAPQFDSAILFLRTDEGKLPWIYLVIPDFHDSRHNDKRDFLSEWTKRNLPIKWDSLNAYEWNALVSHYPQCEEVFEQQKAWECFSGSDWSGTLVRKPWRYAHCDWSKMTSEDWIGLLKTHRQFAAMLPDSLSLDNLLHVFFELPWLKHVLPEDNPAKSRISLEYRKFRTNLQTKGFVIPLQEEDFQWPHPDLALFCGEISNFSEKEQLVILVNGYGRSFKPQDPKKQLLDLAEKIFKCGYLSGKEVCRLERKIISLLSRHEFWEESLLLLDHLSVFVEKANKRLSDMQSSNLSAAVTDCFALFSKGEAQWAKGCLSEAASSFKAIESCHGPRFENQFVKQSKDPFNILRMRTSDDKGLLTQTDESTLIDRTRIELSLADCTQKVPWVLRTWYWYRILVSERNNRSVNKKRWANTRL